MQLENQHEGEENFAALFEESLKHEDIKEGDIVHGTVIQVGKDYVVVDIGYKSEGTDPARRVHAGRRHGRRQGRRRDRRLPREPRERERPVRPLQGEGRPPQGLGRDLRRVRARRADRRHHQRAREGRPLGHHPRRREGVPARLAGRPAPGAQPRRLHRQELQVQGHQVQQEARQHRAVAPRAPREGARRAEGADAREAQGRPDRRGHRQEPHRVRRVHRPRRHRRPAAHHRHELGPRQPPVASCSRSATTCASRSSSSTPRPSASRSASSRSARIRGPTRQEKYPPGTVVRGKVVSLKDYGAFIELEQGIEGLVHISEMSWTRRVKHPSKMVAVGDIVEAVVLDIDPRQNRISLGMKQLEPNPFASLTEKYPPGTVVKGVVRNIADFGIFVEIEEGIDGLVHIATCRWTQRVKHPSELYQKGDEVEAVVLNIDIRRREAEDLARHQAAGPRSVGSHPLRLPGRQDRRRPRSSRCSTSAPSSSSRRASRVSSTSPRSPTSASRIRASSSSSRARRQGRDHQRRHGRAQDRPVDQGREPRGGAGRRAGLHRGHHRRRHARRRHARQARRRRRGRRQQEEEGQDRQEAAPRLRRRRLGSRVSRRPRPALCLPPDPLQHRTTPRRRRPESIDLVVRPDGRGRFRRSG